MTINTKIMASVIGVQNLTLKVENSGANDALAFSAHESSRVVRLAPPQASNHFGQFDDEEGQHETHHRHCGNQISPDVEGVDASGGHDRSRPHHDHDACARDEPGAPTPDSDHRPKYDGDNEAGGQCPEQISGDAWEIGQ
jgi:hypothetical protein